MPPIVLDRTTVLDSILKEMGINFTYDELYIVASGLTQKMLLSINVKNVQDEVERFLKIVIRERHSFWTKKDNGLGRPNKDYIKRVEVPFICTITAVYASSLTVLEAAQLLRVSEKTITNRLKFHERTNPLSKINQLAPKTLKIQRLFGRVLDGEWRIPICQFNANGGLMRNHKILMNHVDEEKNILGFHLMLEMCAPDEAGSLKEWIEYRMTKQLKQIDKETDQEQYIYFALNPSACM